MIRLVQFLASNRDVDVLGVRLDGDKPTVFGFYADSPSGFRIHNVGDIDGIIHFLRCNREVKSFKCKLHGEDGTVRIRALATIADENFELEGYIRPPDEVDSYVAPQIQLQRWLEDFSKKLADVRRKFSLKHA